MTPRPPVAPEKVRAPDDRFYCQPYKATLLASACLSRQAAASKQTRPCPPKMTSAVRSSLLLGDYTLCRGCSVGAGIAERVELPAGKPSQPPAPPPSDDGHEARVAFARAVREERGRRGLKQDQLAALVGVSSTYLSKIESGERGAGRAKLGLERFVAGEPLTPPGPGAAADAALAHLGAWLAEGRVVRTELEVQRPKHTDRPELERAIAMLDDALARISGWT